MAQIITYNEHIEEYYVNKFGVIKQKTAGFFNRDEVVEYCKFCNNKMEIIYAKKEPFINFDNTNGVDTWGKKNDEVRKCSSCGWWQYNYVENIKEEARWYQLLIRFYKGVVKVFNSEDKKLPISVLNEECKKNPVILYQVGTRKFEEFLQCTLKSVYNCEVIHCGKTGDGGIDLLILNSDEPILVQAKRRTEAKSNYAEPIKDIREFLGVMLINKAQKGIYVTTSKKYSKNTEKTINDIIEKKIVTRFDIVNFDALISIFNQKKVIHHAPWEELINSQKYWE